MVDAAKTDPQSLRLRGRPSPDQIREKMADVLAIARQQFVLKGYNAATMNDIAAVSGITKRTLYQWYDDKAALFRACIAEGGARFPVPEISASSDVGTALCDFAVQLLREVGGDYSLGMGMLVLRERQQFDDFADAIQNSYYENLVYPLARYLRERGLEHPDSHKITQVFVSMILSPVHDHMILALPRPTDEDMQRHAALITRMFLAGNPVRHDV